MTAATNFLIVTLVNLIVCQAFPDNFHEFDSDQLHFRNFPSLATKERPQNDAKYWYKRAAEDLEKRMEFVSSKKAKNVIMFLGDGMSVPTLTAARILQAQMNKKSLAESEPLSFEKFLFSGMSRTYCLDYDVADSACSATAYLCGVKGNMATIGLNGRVGMKNAKASADERNHVQSIAYYAQKAGKATGFVTNTRVTHASPAGNYAHIADRNWENDATMEDANVDSTLYDDIAEQLILREPGMNLNVIMGGGRKNFLPRNRKGMYEAGWRLDNVNLIEKWMKHKSSKKTNGGWKYVTTKEELMSMKETPSYLLGLFASEHMNQRYQLEEDQPTLEEMTEKAIKVLQKAGGENGFFLMVEGGMIDFAHHKSHAQIALNETLELSRAVAKAVSMTDDEDTLIVVTADHSHTLTISGYAPEPTSIFGFAGKARDEFPYMILSYANGGGYSERRDLSKDETSKIDYVFPSGVPLSIETHGGDDVAVFATGPNAQIFSGSYDQSYIAYAMAFVANLTGEYFK